MGVWRGCACGGHAPRIVIHLTEACCSSCDLAFRIEIVNSFAARNSTSSFKSTYSDSPFSTPQTPYTSGLCAASSSLQNAGWWGCQRGMDYSCAAQNLVPPVHQPVVHRVGGASGCTGGARKCDRVVVARVIPQRCGRHGEAYNHTWIASAGVFA